MEASVHGTNFQNLKVINKFNNKNYGDPKKVLSETVQKYEQELTPEFLCDSKAKSGFYRAIPPHKIVFPQVDLRKIDNAYITDAFLAFDRKYIYTDSSLKGGLGNFKDEDAHKWALTKINSSIENLSYQYDNEAIAVIHNEGGGTWGHHLIQNFPKILFLQKYFPNLKIALPKSFCNPQSSRGKLLDFYGVNREKILPLDQETTYKFGSIYILDFLFDAKSGFIHPWALEALREYKPNLNTNKSSKLFISRIGKRAIENQDEVQQYLEAKRYKTLIQNHQNLEEQIKLWSSAENVIATLGSDMSNLIFLKENSSILSLSPDWFGDRFFYNLACAAKINWSEIRCGQVGTVNKSSYRFNNFYVDLNVLKKKVC